MLKRKRNPGEVLVVNSKIKAYLASKGMRSSGDLAEALTERIIHKLDRAIERAKSNKRVTVGASDI